MNLLTASLFVLGSLALAASRPAQQPVQRPVTVSDFEAAFARALPPAAEALSTLVPWRRSLTAALVEAKTSGKPVYLFVNDGNVDCGRC